MMIILGKEAILSQSVMFSETTTHVVFVPNVTITLTSDPLN